MRQIKENPHQPFGGCNIILLGDWAQIEPVKAKPLYFKNKNNHNDMFKAGGNL